MDAQFDIEPAVVDRDDLRWDDKLGQLQFEELDRVRAAAEKWAASLGAILGLFGTLVLIKGPDDISGLKAPLPAIVGAVLAVGFLAGAWAIYLAALSAQGTPRTVEFPNPGELRIWEHAEAMRSKDRLRCSRVLTFTAVGLVVTAIALTWYGSRDPGAGSSVVIIPTRGSGSCGNLINSAAGLVVRTKGGVVPVSAASAAKLIAVTNCP